MIEKMQPDQIVGLDGLPTTIMPDSAKLMRKINEIIDVIYDMQLAISSLDPDSDWYDDPIYHEAEPSDPYAEQRKWIGKLCKVYDDNDFIHYAVLEKIFDNSNYCYGTQIGDYRHCEPVKPDDSIIYKGGDNEE